MPQQMPVPPQMSVPEDGEDKLKILAKGSAFNYQDLIRQLGGATAMQTLSAATSIKGANPLDPSADMHAAQLLREEFARDAARLKSRIQRETRGLLDPRSTMMQYWDMSTGIALLFTAFVTPFEVGTGIDTKADGLFALNQLVNTIFIIDIFIQFFLPVPDTRADHVGEVVRSHKMIAKKYLKSWFFLDVVSVLPFDIVVVSGPDLLGNNPTVIKSIKLIRVMRLIKLARVLRTSRIIQRWENRISISYSMRSLWTSVIGIVVILHWFACLWALLPQLQGDWRNATALVPGVEARVAWDGDCSACVADDPSTAAICASPCLTDCEMEVVAASLGESLSFVQASEVWTCRAVRGGYLTANFHSEPFTVWLNALLVAMLQLVGGVGALLPSNPAEYACFIFAILAGTVALAAVQGVIVQVLTTGDPDEIVFRQSLDALNFMMRDQHVPQDHRLFVRDYFRKSKGYLKRKG